MSDLPEREVWSNKTIAEFHLNNAVDEEAYRSAIQQVLTVGLDPTKLHPANLLRGEAWQHPQSFVDHSAGHRRS